MASQQSRRTMVLLVATVAALSALNWHLLEAPVDISPIAPETKQLEGPGKGSTRLATPLDNKPAAQFRETVGRPVFVPDRKPVQRKQPVVKDSAAGLGNMRLIGIMKVDDAPGRALIRMASESTGKWIAEGEQFDGWRLRQVMARGVIVEAGGRSHELKLQSAPPPAEESTEPQADPQQPH